MRNIHHLIICAALACGLAWGGEEPDPPDPPAPPPAETENPPAPEAFDWSTARLPARPIDLFPDDTLLAISVPSGRRLQAHLRACDLGKLVHDPRVEKLRAALMQSMTENERTQFDSMLNWLSRFPGVVTAGVWRVNPEMLFDFRCGAVLQTAPGQGAKAYELHRSLLDPKGAWVPLEGRDGAAGLSILADMNGFGALAQAGDYLLIGVNRASVEYLAAGLREKNAKRLTATEGWTRAIKGVPETYDALLYLRYAAYLDLLRGMQGGTTRLVRERMLGSQYNDHVVYALRADPDRPGAWKEYLSTTYKTDAAKNLWGASSRPKHATLPARMPADALVAVNVTLNGAEEHEAILAYAKEALDWQRVREATEQDGQAQTPPLEDLLGDFTKKTGLNAADLVAPLRGGHTAWLWRDASAAEQADAYPQPAGVLRVIDADQAVKLADRLAVAALSFSEKKEALARETLETGTMYVLDWKAARAVDDGLPPDFKPSWMAHGDELWWAASPEGLKRYVTRRARGAPMLVDREGFAGPWKAASESEREGLFLYADAAGLASWALEAFKPQLAVYARMTGRADLATALNDLPPAKELFKGLQPTLVWEDAALSDRTLTTIKSSVPYPLAAVAGFTGWGLLLMERQATTPAPAKDEAPAEAPAVPEAQEAAE